MKTKSLFGLILTGLILLLFTAEISAQIIFNEAYGLPVLGYGDPGEWDDAVVWYPAVIKDGDTLRMWFTGYDQDIWTHSQIGYAWSLDGIAWNKYSSNPVLVDDLDWEGGEIVGCAVIKDGDTLKMWYGASINNVGYAWSLDGKNWNKNPQPVLGLGSASEWDDGVIVPYSVIKEENEYNMWYYAGRPGFPNEESHTQIGLATSTDGINWTKYDDPATTDAPFAYSDPVLKFGQGGEWDSSRVVDATVLKTTTGYVMMYTGLKSPLNSSSKGHVGMAYSSDGIEWEKDPNNPVLLDDHSFVNWGDGIGTSRLLFYGDEYHYWFSCMNVPPYQTRPQIGYAKSLNTNGWERMAGMPQSTGYYGSCVDPISEKAYIFGGGGPSETLLLLNTTQIYDFNTDTWSLGANMPYAASSFSAEMVNGNINIIGEFLKPQTLSNVKEYDPNNNTWTTKGQLPEIFYAHGSCVYDGLIYSFGGRDDDFNLINTVRNYDPSTDTWNELANMPDPRDKSAVCIYENEIYLFGDNPSLKYTPSTDSWAPINAGICEIVAYAVPIIDGDRILLFGGYKSGGSYPNPCNEIWAYYPTQDTLVKLDNEMPFNRFTRGHKYNNYVYLFGGHFNNTIGSVTNEVWRINLDSIPTDINENEYVVRENFILGHIFPNPFTTSTTIEYVLTKPSTVQLTIYDYLGKQLEVIEKKQAQGKQQIIWNAEGLPAGVYFCVIKTNKGTNTTKLIKL